MSGGDGQQAGLRIEADLTVGLSASTVRIESSETADRLHVDARSFGALRELRAAAESDAVELLRRLGVDSPLAVRTPVVVRVRGVAVGSYQPDQPAGRLADLFGIAPFRPSVRGVVRAAVRRLRPLR